MHKSQPLRFQQFYRCFNSSMQPSPSPILSKRNIRYSSLSRESPHCFDSRYQQPQSQNLQHNQHYRLNQRLTSLTRAENTLEKEISDINLSLQRKQKRMGVKNGIFFQIEVDYHLANALRELIQRRIQVIGWGLKFENQPLPKQDAAYKKGRMLPAIDSSGRLKPLQRSHAKDEEKYTFQGYQGYREAASLFIDKWQYFSKGVTPKYYKDRKRLKTQQLRSNHSINISQELSRSLHFDPSHSNINNSVMLGSKSLIERVNYSKLSPTRSVNRSRVERQNSHVPSPPQIFDILSKQNRLISIWLSPSTNPELLGVMTLLVRQKQDGTLLCLIRKYWWSKKAISRRFFNYILDWLCKHHGLTEELTLLTSKPTFDEVFAPLGWKLINWMREDKLRVSYKRTLF